MLRGTRIKGWRYANFVALQASAAPFTNDVRVISKRLLSFKHVGCVLVAYFFGKALIDDETN